MEKSALIVNVKHFAIHDGDGIRTTFIFKGCPLHCSWCHNPESISFQPELAFYEHKCNSCQNCVSVCPTKAHTFVKEHHEINRNRCNSCGLCVQTCYSDALILYGKKITLEEALKEALTDKEFYLESGGGITLSGGEPLMQSAFCLDFLKKLKQYNLNTAVDTCGYVSQEILNSVFPYVDTFLYDIKTLNDKVHLQHTGKHNKLILSNLEYLINLKAKIEIRLPLIPHVNDGESDIRAIAELLQKYNYKGKIRLLPFNQYAKAKYIALDKYYEHQTEKQSINYITKLSQIINKFGFETIF